MLDDGDTGELVLLDPPPGGAVSARGGLLPAPDLPAAELPLADLARTDLPLPERSALPSADRLPDLLPQPIGPQDFAGLYTRHRLGLAAQARGFLRNRDEAEEVVQDAFLRLFQTRPTFRCEAEALAYCRRTVQNLCIDRYRAAARRPTNVALESCPPELFPLVEPLDPLVRAEEAAEVRSALAQLSPLHQQALVKREVEEKPLQLIAAELAVSEDGVKHLLFRARRALRRRLSTTPLEAQPRPGGRSAGQPAGGRLVRPAAVRGGGKVASLAALLAMALGIGTTTDLHSVPLTGWQLPEVPLVTEVARPVASSLSKISALTATPPAPSTPPATPEQVKVTMDRMLSEPMQPAPAPSTPAASDPLKIVVPTVTAPPTPPAADSRSRPSAKPAMAVPSAAAVLPALETLTSPSPKPTASPAAKTSPHPAASGSPHPTPSGAPPATPAATPDPSGTPTAPAQPSPAQTPAPDTVTAAGAPPPSSPGPSPSPTPAPTSGP